MFDRNISHINIYGPNNDDKTYIFESLNKGITHVLSCINICWVPMKVLKHVAHRPSAQTSPEGPGKC